MSQPEFLIRYRGYGSYKPRIVQTHGEGIRYDRESERRDGSTYVLSTPDKSRIRVEPRGDSDLEATGVKANRGWVELLTRPFTAPQVKAVLRRLRPEDARELDGYDIAIRDAKDLLEKLRTMRAAEVQKAWARAHVVRLNEVLALVEEGQ